MVQEHTRPLTARQMYPLSRPYRHNPLLLVALAVLFLGPIIAPLFQASGLAALVWSGALARDLLASYVCPTPAKSYLLLGFPMAVCARCWGATIGLWIAYLWSRRMPAHPRLPMIAGGWRLLALQLIVALGAFLLWPLEIYGEAQGWWYAPYWLLLLNGALFGILGGSFVASLFRR